MAEKKMTRKEALTTLIEIAEEWKSQNFATDEFGGWHTEEAIAIAQKMLEQVSKPRKRAEGPSKARLNNERLAREVADALAAKGEPASSKWIAEHVNGILTPQKVTAVAKVGAELGLIVKVVDGRNIYYTVAE